MLLALPRTQPRRVPVTRPGPSGRAKAPSSRPLYTSRTAKGPFLTPSIKADGLQACESSLESLFVAAATFDHRVKAIRTQPCVVDVETALVAPTRDDLCRLLAERGYPSVPRCWFVDAELALAAEPAKVFVEVKPQIQLPAYAERLQQRRAACERLGVGFLVVTDDDLSTPVDANLRVLRRYMRHVVPNAVTTSMKTLASRGPVCIADLIAATAGCLADSYALIARGELLADLRAAPLGPATVVRTDGACGNEILPLS